MSCLRLGQEHAACERVPENSNIYRIPEGYLWRRAGQPDSEFTANLTIQRQLVVPINGIVPYVTGSGQAADALPTTIWMEVTMRLFGLAPTCRAQTERLVSASKTRPRPLTGESPLSSQLAAFSF